MRRATSVHAKGTWPQDREVATVTLDFEDRHRRRIRLVDDGGADFLLDLPEATRFGDGDALAVVDSGDMIRVIAAAEAVADITAPDIDAAVKLAWHIGNRHTPMQVLPGGGLRIRDDHVLVAMVERLGAEVHRHHAGFSPEAGAYHDGGGAGHHHHDQDHDHAHGHADSHDAGGTGHRHDR